MSAKLSAREVLDRSIVDLGVVWTLVGISAAKKAVLVLARMLGVGTSGDSPKVDVPTPVCEPQRMTPLTAAERERIEADGVAGKPIDDGPFEHVVVHALVGHTDMIRAVIRDARYHRTQLAEARRALEECGDRSRMAASHEPNPWAAIEDIENIAAAALAKLAPDGSG